MATLTKAILSGSTDGRPIGVTATAGAITLHTGSTSTNTIDEIYLWAQNNYSQVIDLVIEFGTTATTAMWVHPIPSRDGLELVIPGTILQGRSAAGQTVGAYIAGLNGSSSLAASANFVTVSGYVNRITQ